MVKNEISSAIYKKNLSLKNLPSIRQLRAFVTVYHTGNLSVAAQTLALTQPAVTLLLKELEEKLGVRLFDRNTRMLRRTPAAVEAIVFAERALGELEALNRSMSDLSGLRRGKVCIAATSTVAQTLLPGSIRRFLDRHPDVQVSVDDCAPDEFAEHVLMERADVGVGTLERPITGLQEQVVLNDPLCAVATRQMLQAEQSLTWKQLARLPVILVRPGYGVRRSINHAVQQADVPLRPAFEVSLLTTALAMAANGLGVAVLPRSMLAHTHYGQLVSCRLIRPTVQRRTAVVFKQERALSPSAQAFVTLLTQDLTARRN